MASPLTVVSTVFEQTFGLKAKEAEMGAALFTKNGDGSSFDLQRSLQL